MMARATTSTVGDGGTGNEKTSETYFYRGGPGLRRTRLSIRSDAESRPRARGCDRGQPDAAVWKKKTTSTNGSAPNVRILENESINISFSSGDRNLFARSTRNLLPKRPPNRATSPRK